MVERPVTTSHSSKRKTAPKTTDMIGRITRWNMTRDRGRPTR